MVNVMPNHNPTSTLPPRPLTHRAIVALLAAAFLLLSASGTAHAAIQAAAPDDSFLSGWTYVTIFGVLLLVALIAYKKLRPTEKWIDVSEPVKSPGRTARAENPALTNARVAAEPSVITERRAPVIEGAQVWEKPVPVDLEPSVYGAYRIDQEVGKLIVGK